MRKLLILAVFYFFATNRGSLGVVVGPFQIKQDCEKVRVWYGTVSTASVCWEAPN